MQDRYRVPSEEEIEALKREYDPEAEWNEQRAIIGTDKPTLDQRTRLNQIDHEKRLREGEDPVVSLIKLYGRDYTDGVIDERTFDLVGSSLGRIARRTRKAS